MQPKQEDVINDLLQQVASLIYANTQLKSVINQYQEQEEQTKEEENK